MLHYLTRTIGVQLVLVLITLLLAACGQDKMADLNKYVAATNARENNNVPPLPEFKHIPSYFYEVANMRDPFISRDYMGIEEERRRENNTDQNNVPQKTCPLRPNPYRVRAGLELMPIDSLRMVGTAESEGILWGLVTTPHDGTTYRVQSGDYLGQNSGKVVNIAENQIELMELIPDKQGCWTETLTTLPLTHD